MSEDRHDAAGERAARVAADPRYQALVAKRARFGWTLTAVMLLAYFGYVLLIAFDKPLMGRPIGDGVTSIGIPLGFGIIILGVALTAIYVTRANREFDAVLDEVLAEHGE